MNFSRTSTGRWVFIALGCLLLLLALAGYKFLQIRSMIAFAASFPEPSETVESTLVQTQLWSESATAVGEVLAPQTVELRNELEGRVVAIGFHAGDAIKKDQMLLKLDASEDIAQLRAAQADADLAKITLARYEKLMAQRLVSREQYDQTRAQYAVAAARAQALQATIDKKIITAPFDGRAGLHNLQLGQYLAANTLITQLVGSLNTVWVDFYLPQQQGNIAINSPVSISASGILNTPLTGKVIAVDQVISTTSRNLKLRAAIDNTNDILKPGALVDVQIATAPSRTVIAIPSTAVQYSDNGRFVYIITPAEKGELRAKARPVTTGEERNRYVLIDSGLTVGEHIATDGAYKLHDGMLVYTKDAVK
jgi:membrane fusion protein (multidrug efflux system)